MFYQPVRWKPPLLECGLAQPTRTEASGPTRARAPCHPSGSLSWGVEFPRKVGSRRARGSNCRFRLALLSLSLYSFHIIGVSAGARSNKSLDPDHPPLLTFLPFIGTVTGAVVCCVHSFYLSSLDLPASFRVASSCAPRSPWRLPLPHWRRPRTAPTSMASAEVSASAALRAARRALVLRTATTTRRLVLMFHTFVASPKPLMCANKGPPQRLSASHRQATSPAKRPP